MWSRLVQGNGGYADSQCDNTPKRHGGPKVAAWARSLRWAASVGFDEWEASVHSLLDEIETATGGALSSLLGALRQFDDKFGARTAEDPKGGAAEPLPDALRALLVERYGEDFGTSRIDTHHPSNNMPPHHQGALACFGGAEVGDISALPLATLGEGVEVEWVETSERVREVEALLRARAAEAAGRSSSLRIGIDTEWADAEVPTETAPDTGGVETPTSRRTAPPRVAVVQLAVWDRIWVIDALAAGNGDPIGALLRWMLEADVGVTTLGFAFRGDLGVLEPLCVPRTTGGEAPQR